MFPVMSHLASLLQRIVPRQLWLLANLLNLFFLFLCTWPKTRLAKCSFTRAPMIFVKTLSTPPVSKTSPPFAHPTCGGSASSWWCLSRRSGPLPQPASPPKPSHTARSHRRSCQQYSPSAGEDKKADAQRQKWIGVRRKTTNSGYSLELLPYNKQCYLIKLYLSVANIVNIKHH